MISALPSTSTLMMLGSASDPRMMTGGWRFSSLRSTVRLAYATFSSGSVQARAIIRSPTTVVTGITCNIWPSWTAATSSLGKSNTDQTSSSLLDSTSRAKGRRSITPWESMNITTPKPSPVSITGGSLDSSGVTLTL